jgi:hypothetical protein
MSLSTDSIIHYTSSFENLVSILSEGFAIKYCAESLVVDGQSGSSAAHPMICFCDIPLSQSTVHFESYGKYGIGLSKNWANKMKINPVLYLESKSSITATIAQLLKERRKRKTHGNLTSVEIDGILRIKCFSKNYSGTVKRNGVITKKYIFYNEREWRLVPLRDAIDGAPFSVNMSTYLDNKDKYNNRIAHLRYPFAAADISYIVVKKTREIPLLIKELRKIYGTQGNQSSLDLLMSKICSSEQIVKDY